MDLNEFAKEVHALAVEKGFYDPQPTDAELIAAIHSEISEAFEEWRSDKPMLWHWCKLNDEICNEDYPCHRDTGCSLHWMDNEPHGIAAELIDVALRILDTAAAWEFDVPLIEAFDLREDVDFPSLVAELHWDVANAWMELASGERDDGMGWLLMTALPNIYTWLRAQNIDPELLLLEKHQYNQTRPYKHGGKRI